jgi:hypothetical protein
MYIKDGRRGAWAAFEGLRSRATELKSAGGEALFIRRQTARNAVTF